MALDLLKLFGEETHHRLTREYHAIVAGAGGANVNEAIVLEVPERFEEMVGGRYFGVPVVPVPEFGPRLDEPRWQRRNEPWTKEQIDLVMGHVVEAILSPHECSDLDAWQSAVDAAIECFVSTVAREDRLRGLRADSKCINVASQGERVRVSWEPRGQLQGGLGRQRPYEISDFHPMDFGGWNCDTEEWIAETHMLGPLVDVADDASGSWLKTAPPPADINGLRIVTGSTNHWLDDEAMKRLAQLDLQPRSWTELMRGIAEGGS